MEQKRWINTLILTVLLAGLSTFAYWLEYKHAPKKEAQEEGEKKLFSLKNKNIDRIEMESPKGRVVLKCESDIKADKDHCTPDKNSQWSVVEPVQYPANDSNVHSLVSTLNNINPSETVDLSSDTDEKQATLLTEYGLARGSSSRGSVRVAIVLHDQKTLRGAFGSESPINEGIFAIRQAGDGSRQELEDKKVFVIPGYTKKTFENDLSYWRSKKVAEFSGEANSLRLIYAGTNLELSQQEGQWRVTSGSKKNLEGDSSTIDQFLEVIKALEAKDFLSEEKEGKTVAPLLAGSSRKLWLEIGFKDAALKPVSLEIKVRPDKKLVLLSSLKKPIFEYESSQVEKLQKTFGDFRSKKLLPTAEHFQYKLARFYLGLSSKTPLVTLVANGGSWKIEGDDKAQVDTQQIEKFWESFSSGKVQEFLEVSKETPKGQVFRIEFSDEKVNPKRSFAVWVKGNDTYFMDLLRAAGQREVWKVTSEIKNLLPFTSKSFQVVPAPTSSVSSSSASSAK